MILLETKQIVQGDKVEDIIEFQVWFSTPFGVTSNLNDAIKRCKEVDLGPNLCIKPITVALSETMYEASL